MVFVCRGENGGKAVSLPQPEPPPYIRNCEKAFVSASSGSVKFDERLVGRTDGVGETPAVDRRRAGARQRRPSHRYKTRRLLQKSRYGNEAVPANEQD